MKRLAAGVLVLALCLPLWAAAAPVKGGAPLEVVGDTVTVVRALPFTLKAKAGADFYFWTFPDAWKATPIDNELTVTAAPKGTYRASVLCVTIDFKDGKKVVTKERQEAEVNVGDVPGPGPGPTPDPGPVPTPAPIPVDGLRVLIVYETAERKNMPESQDAILTSVPFRAYLNSVCTDDPQTGTKKAWWMLDKDSDVSSLAKHWQDAMKRPRKSVPWIIVSNGKTGYEGALPANIDETKALVAKYAGSKRGGK